jgi:hypothetical protein
MAKSTEQKGNNLIERMVRNEDIFCSILFDTANRTLRVIDFRGGSFQTKHSYLEQISTSEGMRKIFTLIERDDMSGWQRVGYSREGSIPGYYKRSDAYIMGRVYDNGEPDSKSVLDSNAAKNKEFVNGMKEQGKELSENRLPSIRLESVTEELALDALQAEVKRIASKTKKSKTDKTAKTKTKVKKKKGSDVFALDTAAFSPLFQQFSREVEQFYFTVTNSRTKQMNLVGAEYQDCFGNAKLSLFFEPQNRAEQNLARAGISGSIDMLAEMGAVSMFALARADSESMNVVFASLGFRNTGWLSRQVIDGDGAVDMVLWTRKLI